MSTRIRLKRMGSKKRPFYRMVVADQRAPRDGRFIEELGYYNPLTKELKIDDERAQHWLSVGAQPTDTARALIKKSASGEPIVKKEKPKKKEAAPAAAPVEAQAEEKAEAAVEEAPAEETPVEEAAETPAEEAAEEQS